ncbi:hypothetical protein [Vibrio parahaemolyticus]|uniref:hypothetical protein n=1 Tax=Vibrio parahaemolyticus TaxID=670 RepID=UPI000A91F582|nr:hypothetical protein [Vibrio parahaemolyticus]
MMKTSYSTTYSTESSKQDQNLSELPSTLFTQEQLQFIENIQFPERLFLVNATEFDDQFVYLHSEWRYRFSGENKAILFAKGKQFSNLSPVAIKLIKYLTVKYIEENSASSADRFAVAIATSFSEIESITRATLIDKLQLIVTKTDSKPSDNSLFYYTLYALRKLERNGFFESTDNSDDLEDLLLEVPRPRNENWGRYQNLDLVIPDEVSLMIENGVQLWASKLSPKLETKEAKAEHLDKLKKSLKINVLRDCIILGIVYYTGARPVQIGKFSGSDYVIDTVNKHGMRYSVLVPYAKKSKLTIDRVRVAIPEELGKLIMLYKFLDNIGDNDPMFPTQVSSKKMVDESLKNMLLRFSPKSIQEAVKNGEYELPAYTRAFFVTMSVTQWR